MTEEKQLAQIYKDFLEYGIKIKSEEKEYVIKGIFQAFLIGQIHGLKEGKKIYDK